MKKIWLQIRLALRVLELLLAAGLLIGAGVCNFQNIALIVDNGSFNSFGTIGLIVSLPLAIACGAYFVHAYKVTKVAKQKLHAVDHKTPDEPDHP